MAVHLTHDYAIGQRPVFGRLRTLSESRSLPMAAQHPQIDLTPQAVTRLRVWMVERCVPGTAEALIGGLLIGGEGVIDDTVIDEVMAYIDQLIALYGPQWFAVLERRGAGVDSGVRPIEPRLN